MLTRNVKKRNWSVDELLKLPREQRSAILAEAAEQAAPLYEGNRELTTFEAFGKDDLYGDSASSVKE